MALLTKLFARHGGSSSSRLRSLAAQVNAREASLRARSDAELPALLKELRSRLAGGEVSLDALIPDTFALVRETARRVLKERPFDVQIMGAVALHEGNIAEMKTGEGKTLVATMPVVLNALSGKGVHLVTVNEYLARRDARWMGDVYSALGLSVGVTLHGQSAADKRAAYAADVTYGTNNEFGFDYLRDNMALHPAERVQRELHYAIVDEADSILIDEARTPLIISAPDKDSTKLYAEFARLVPRLSRGIHYAVDEKQRAVTLTDEGISHTEKLLGRKDLYESAEIRLIHHLEQALRAHALYARDRDYVVKNGEVVIVDAFTGRLMPGRRYSEGLHQAIEAKEEVAVQAESRTLATITFQNYFRLYRKLSGMTGTAATSREEFQKVYDLDVVVIPTHRQMIRKDLPDRIYATETAKLRAIVEAVKERHARAQPVLVGTIAIEKSELLSRSLARAGVPHEVLNAKHHEREAQIVAKAGQRGAVTISTNMAGRGTDIKLGPGVTERGGLFVLGTERHEARRIDNQLRGRSGRQGDPGESQFFISLEDDVMRIFASDRVKLLLRKLKVPEDEPIESRMVSRAVEAAQAKVEGFYFDTRRHVLEYDDVMNKQREAFYRLRRRIVDSGEDQASLRETVVPILTDALENALTTARATAEPAADIEGTTRTALDRFVNTTDEEWSGVGSALPSLAEDSSSPSVRDALQEIVEGRWAARAAEISESVFAAVVRLLLVRTLDLLWTEHLDTIEYLRTGIGLRGYGQRDPLVEFRHEAHQLFRTLLARFREESALAIFHVTIHAPHASRAEPSKEAVGAPLRASPPSTPPLSGRLEPKGDEKVSQGAVFALKKGSAVGRNEPCPCGSGKKFKKCHGSNAS